MNIFDFFTKFVMFFVFILKINSMNNVNFQKDNCIDISKLEIDSFRPDNNIVINDPSVNSFENNNEQNIKGGIDDIDDDMHFASENKFIKHCSKYKLFYVLGGVLLVGTGIGLYFLIKHLTNKTEEVPITIPTDILTYNIDNLTDIPVSDNITDIITDENTTIPTTIPELECNDTSSLCNSIYLNESRENIDTYFNLTEGVDYCFGNIKNKINKIGLMFDENPNCILFTNKIVDDVFPYHKIFGDNVEYINILYNDLTFFNLTFSNLKNLRYIDLTNFDTSNIKVFSGFFNASNISEIVGLENKNFTNEVDLGKFFSFTNLPKMLNLNWNINVNSLVYFLQGSEGIENLTLQNFILKNLTNLEYSFYSKSLKFLNLTNICTDGASDIENIFNYDVLEKVILNKTCNSLIINELKKNSFFCIQNEKLSDITICINQECNDVSEFCNYNLILNSLRIKLSGEMHKVYGVDYCFGEMKNKTNKIGFIINDDPNCILTTNILFHYDDYEKSVFCHKGVFSLNVTFNNMSNLCNAFRELQLDKLDISNLNTNNVNNMASMFHYSNITKLYGYENKNFDEIVDFQYFFRYGTSGNSINLSTWNIKVNNVREAFYDSYFETIDLSNFDFNDVKSFSLMFYSYNLKYLYIKNWDTSNITNVDFDSFLGYLYVEEVYLNMDKNKIITNLLTDNSFSCSDNKCVKQSNNKLTNLIKNRTIVKENNTSSYSNNGVNYFFELSGKIYNITSYLVNDYIVNPFQRLLRMLR